MALQPTALTVATRRSRRVRPRAGFWFSGLVIVSLVALLAAPWSFQDTSLAVLHGLCAQRPTHSFWFGGWRLPFDARMTGIYGGCLVTHVYLLLRGRFRAAGTPSLSILLLLILFVILMGIDGINSTLDDLGLVHLYEPRNDLRFATGALTGTTLAVLLWLLSSSVLWRPSERSERPIIDGWSDLLLIVVLLSTLGLLARSGWIPLYRPLALALVVAAVLVLLTLTLVFLQVARNRIGGTERLADLAAPATIALLTVYALMLVISGSRFIMELSGGIAQRP